MTFTLFDWRDKYAGACPKLPRELTAQARFTLFNWRAKYAGVLRAQSLEAEFNTRSRH
jgi:hypothetical protein